MKYRTCWHLLHLILSIIFFPWLIVWFCLAISAARHNRAVNAAAQRAVLEESKKQTETLALLYQQMKTNTKIQLLVMEESDKL